MQKFGKVQLQRDSGVYYFTHTTPHTQAPLLYCTALDNQRQPTNPHNVMNKYEVVNMLGEGAYGQVYY